MKSVSFFFILLASTVSAQKFDPVPQNPQEIVRFRQSFALAGEDSLITFKLIEDGRQLFVLSERTIQIFDARNRQILASFDNKIPKIDSLVRFHAISPDGQKAVSLDLEDQRLTKFRKFLSKKGKLPAIVWDLKTAAQIAVLEGEAKSIRRAIWSEDGKTLLTTSGAVAGDTKETEICFWTGENYAARKCALFDGRLGWHQLSRDGKRFFAAVTNEFYGRSRVMVWNTDNLALLHEFEAPDGVWGYDSTHLSPNERFFAVQTAKSVEVWELGNFSKKFQIDLPRKSSWIAFGSFSPDEKSVAVKNGKNGTEIYETATGALKSSIPQNESVPYLWADNGKVLLNSVCGEATAYSVESGNLLYKLKLVCKTSTDLVSSSIDDADRVILHPATKYFLTKSETAVRIWNAASGELLQTLVNPAQAAEKRRNPRTDDKIKGKTCFWSADGKYLYVEDSDEKSVLQYEFVAV